MNTQLKYCTELFKYENVTVGVCEFIDTVSEKNNIRHSHYKQNVKRKENFVNAPFRLLTKLLSLPAGPKGPTRSGPEKARGTERRRELHALHSTFFPAHMEGSTFFS